MLPVKDEVRGLTWGSEGQGERHTSPEKGSLIRSNNFCAESLSSCLATSDHILVGRLWSIFEELFQVIIRWPPYRANVVGLPLSVVVGLRRGRKEGAVVGRTIKMLDSYVGRNEGREQQQPTRMGLCRERVEAGRTLASRSKDGRETSGRAESWGSNEGRKRRSSMMKGGGLPRKRASERK